MNYKEFVKFALKRYHELPIEGNELYKRMYIDIDREENAKIEANNKDCIEEVKEKAKKTGIKFDLVITNNSYIMEGNLENISISDEISNYNSIEVSDKYEALEYATAKQIIKINAKKGQDASFAIAIGDSRSMSSVIETNVEEGAHLKIFEWLLPGEKESSRNYLNLQHVGKKGILEFTILDTNDIISDVAINTRSWLDENATIEASFVYLGGRKVRARNYIYGKENSSILTNDIAIASGQQKKDIATESSLAGVNTSANMSSKAIAKEEAECMMKTFAGSEINAVDSNSNIEEKGLIKDLGRVYFLPGMNILCGNAKAKHSSFIGPLDNSALFYLLSRGLSRSDAEYILLRGFLAPSISLIKEGIANEAASSVICNKLLGKDEMQEINAGLITWQGKRCFDEIGNR
ncbi:MAG: SufD family Fe-S cluster assembly protein [Candidatus Micrarchaeaceae archaeon]